MREELLFSVDTPYRQPLPVRGWRFGPPEEKSLAVMGALRGNELQQMYVCSQLIQALQAAEAEGRLSPNCGVLVIPCANQFSMNVGRRFWAADNTDINRMFPGYDGGETTQRIAARIFQVLQGYRYGVQLTSFYLPGDFIPHVRIIETGYQHVEEAEAFGLPYTVLRSPQPYDTTTLNYNWQIWNTQAFSLYTRETSSVDRTDARPAVEAVLRFLTENGLLAPGSGAPALPAGEHTTLVPEAQMHNVLSSTGGLFLRRHGPGELVAAGTPLAEIVDPCTGQIREVLTAACAGRIFFAHKIQLMNGHDVAFRILPTG